MSGHLLRIASVLRSKWGEKKGFCFAVEPQNDDFGMSNWPDGASFASAFLKPDGLLLARAKPP